MSRIIVELKAAKLRQQTKSATRKPARTQSPRHYTALNRKSTGIYCWHCLHIVRGIGSTKRYGVRPFVCPSLVFYLKYGVGPTPTVLKLSRPLK